MWIIPARAGFTRGGPLSVTRWRDHPRSRGVYAELGYVWEEDGGSSPLARGLRPVSAPMIGIIGIIPARAGFTHATVLSG